MMDEGSWEDACDQRRERERKGWGRDSRLFKAYILENIQSNHKSIFTQWSQPVSSLHPYRSFIKLPLTLKI
jgi:hypothetical protein